MEWWTIHCLLLPRSFPENPISWTVAASIHLKCRLKKTARNLEGDLYHIFEVCLNIPLRLDYVGGKLHIQEEPPFCVHTYMYICTTNYDNYIHLCMYVCRFMNIQTMGRLDWFGINICTSIQYTHWNLQASLIVWHGTFDLLCYKFAITIYGHLLRSQCYILSVVWSFLIPSLTSVTLYCHS